MNTIMGRNMAWIGDLRIALFSGGTAIAEIADPSLSVQLLDDIIYNRIKVDDHDFKGSSYRNAIVVRLCSYHPIAEIYNRELWIRYLKKALGAPAAGLSPVQAFILDNQCRSALELYDAFPELSIQSCAGHIGSAMKKKLLQ